MMDNLMWHVTTMNSLGSTAPLGEMYLGYTPNAICTGIASGTLLLIYQTFTCLLYAYHALEELRSLFSAKG
jgi:hypothetical protein